MDLKDEETRIFVDFINSYSQCFLFKDIAKLKEFYSVNENNLIYFDNHKNNDTYRVNDHLDLIFNFFKNGKKTESGDVEPIIIENLNIFHKGETACLCFISRYESFPDPAVRCTLYLELLNEKWKIIHAHYSFQPDM